MSQKMIQLTPAQCKMVSGGNGFIKGGGRREPDTTTTTTTASTDRSGFIKGGG